MRHLLLDKIGVKIGTVIDVGSGRGDQLEAVEELGFQGIGLDLEKPFNPELEFFRCDVAKDRFPISDSVADVVFCKSVIEHLYLFQMGHFFSEMKRICKADGYIMISTPDWECNFKEFYREFTHCTPFTLRSMEHCCKIHGMSEVETYSLTPLPSTWNSNAIRMISDVIRVISPPKRWGKFSRWSQERQVVGWGRVKK